MLGKIINSPDVVHVKTTNQIVEKSSTEKNIITILQKFKYNENEVENIAKFISKNHNRIIEKDGFLSNIEVIRYDKSPIKIPENIIFRKQSDDEKDPYVFSENLTKKIYGRNAIIFSMEQIANSDFEKRFFFEKNAPIQYNGVVFSNLPFITKPDQLFRIQQHENFSRTSLSFFPKKRSSQYWGLKDKKEKQINIKGIDFKKLNKNKSVNLISKFKYLLKHPSVDDFLSSDGKKYLFYIAMNIKQNEAEEYFKTQIFNQKQFLANKKKKQLFLREIAIYNFIKSFVSEERLNEIEDIHKTGKYYINILNKKELEKVKAIISERDAYRKKILKNKCNLKRPKKSKGFTVEKFWKKNGHNLKLNKKTKQYLFTSNSKDCAGLEAICEHEKKLYVDKAELVDIISEFADVTKITPESEIFCEFCGKELSPKYIDLEGSIGMSGKYVETAFLSKSLIQKPEFVLSIIFFMFQYIDKAINLSPFVLFDFISEILRTKHNEIEESRIGDIEKEEKYNVMSFVVVFAVFINLIVLKITKFANIKTPKTKSEIFDLYKKIYFVFFNSEEYSSSFSVFKKIYTEIQKMDFSEFVSEKKINLSTTFVNPFLADIKTSKRITRAQFIGKKIDWIMPKVRENINELFLSDSKTNDVNTVKYYAREYKFYESINKFLPFRLMLLNGEQRSYKEKKIKESSIMVGKEEIKIGGKILKGNLASKIGYKIGDLFYTEVILMFGDGAKDFENFFKKDVSSKFIVGRKKSNFVSDKYSDKLKKFEVFSKEKYKKIVRKKYDNFTESEWKQSVIYVENLIAKLITKKKFSKIDTDFLIKYFSKKDETKSEYIFRLRQYTTQIILFAGPDFAELRSQIMVEKNNVLWGLMILLKKIGEKKEDKFIEIVKAFWSDFISKKYVGKGDFNIRMSKISHDLEKFEKARKSPFNNVADAFETEDSPNAIYNYEDEEEGMTADDIMIGLEGEEYELSVID